MDNGKNISNEKAREYYYNDDYVVVIEEPKTIWLSENGHRIEDKNGGGHYVFLDGVRHIRWIVHDIGKVVEI